MVYGHVVKYNGEYYEAGQEVPIGESPSSISNEQPLYSDPEINFENGPHRYTEEELSEMTVKDIRKLAEDMGFSLKKISREDVVNEFLEKQFR